MERHQNHDSKSGYDERTSSEYAMPRAAKIEAGLGHIENLGDSLLFGFLEACEDS